MQIQITYTEENDIMVLVTLSVIDPEDYPTKRIFQGPFDYPTNAAFRLGVGNSIHISSSFPYATEAVIWAQDQLQALKHHLSKWRGENILETQTLWI